MDKNPGCEAKKNFSNTFYDCSSNTAIQPSFSTLNTITNEWTSQIFIPWTFLNSEFKIGGDSSPFTNKNMREWSINLFSIRMTDKSVEACDFDSCEYTTVSSSFKKPFKTFHMCDAFIKTQLAI